MKNYINDLAIINKITLEIMNFKERGITVGDLLLIIIFIVSTFFIVSKVKDNEKQTSYYIKSYEILKTNYTNNS